MISEFRTDIVSDGNLKENFEHFFWSVWGVVVVDMIPQKHVKSTSVYGLKSSKIIYHCFFRKSSNNNC